MSAASDGSGAGSRDKANAGKESGIVGDGGDAIGPWRLWKVLVAEQ